MAVRQLLSLFTLLPSAFGMATSLSVMSPNQQLVVTVSDESDAPFYQVSYRGETIIAPSLLGLEFKQQGQFGPGFVIADSQRSRADNTWEQPWGERRLVRDQHNELMVTLQNQQAGAFNVRFRVFDDGLGFRYEVNEQPGMTQVDVTDEMTRFNIPNPQQTTAWWIPARAFNRYEYIYRTTSLPAMERANTPLTFKLPSGVHLSIHEAALVDWSGMVLDQRRDGELKVSLTPWSDGVMVKTAAPFKSSWRTVQVADNAAQLANSSLILNLNEPNKLGDVSWVEPGKYIGIWWGMHINKYTWGSGPQHGATTANTKAYMDFAAEHGFDGVLVEGWNIGWDGEWFHNGDLFSFTQPYADFDIAELGRYGKQKGVKLIGHHETSGNVTNYRNQMDDAFALYTQHGVSQIKTGYVADGGDIKRIDANGHVRNEWHDGQFMVGEYLHNVQLAAKYKLSINTHEPVKDTGLRRTYPNWLSREGARGQEFNAWGSPPNPPEHTAMLPFTRMLAGPMDFTPGIFDMHFGGDKPLNRPQTTLAKQLALYVVLYSPIQMAADLPENYTQHMDAFQFIKDVPTDWEESIALDGAVGDFVVFARQQRGGSDWYLGALTDEDARNVTVKLDFLEPGKRYEAQIYRDGDKAHWDTNPYDYVIEKRQVTANDSLNLQLAASGGSAIRFKAL